MTELSFGAIEAGKRYGPWKYPRDIVARHAEAVGNRYPWHHGRSPWGPAVAPPSVLAAAAVWAAGQIAPLPADARLTAIEMQTDAALRLDRQPILHGRLVERRDGASIFDIRCRDETGLIIGGTRVTVQEQGQEQGTGNKEQGDAGFASEERSLTRQVSTEALAVYPAGIPGPASLLAADLISEIMEGALGREWYAYATLALSFPHPVREGDTLTAGIRLSSATEEGAVVRRVYDVRCTTQLGRHAAAGTASSLVMRGER